MELALTPRRLSNSFASTSYATAASKVLQSTSSGARRLHEQRLSQPPAQAGSRQLLDPLPRHVAVRTRHRICCYVYNKALPNYTQTCCVTLSATVKLRDQDPHLLDACMHACMRPMHQVIMDGSHRWAKRRGYDTFAGHQAGLGAFKRMVALCGDYGIQALTVCA